MERSPAQKMQWERYRWKGWLRGMRTQAEGFMQSKTLSTEELVRMHYLHKHLTSMIHNEKVTTPKMVAHAKGRRQG